MGEYERRRAERNFSAHAEATLAMCMWSREYAYEQTGGVMDFWDNLDPTRKRLCVESISRILEAYEKNGRSE